MRFVSFGLYRVNSTEFQILERQDVWIRGKTKTVAPPFALPSGRGKGRRMRRGEGVTEGGREEGDQMSDILTKPLSTQKHQKCIKELGICFVQA